jgi:hypothetical protein
MSAFIGAINVQDYAPVVGGVPQIGQGITDDTQAIMDAIQALTQMSLFPPDDVPVTLRTSPTLYFPAGIYNISDQITITSPLGCIKILGENVIIRPDPNQSGNPFVGEYALRVSDCEDFQLIDLSFLGFNKAVRLENGNPNSMQVVVRGCTFMSNQVGLEMSCQSTISVIEKSKFFENKKAIHLFTGDKVTIRDCWIESGTMSDIEVGEDIMKWPAQIENHARLAICNCVLVPHLPIDATEPAWINNYKSVEVYNTRQGGESGSFTLVNNFAGVGDLRFSAENEPNAVTVRDCQCYAIYGNETISGSQPAVLRYVDAIPSQTLIENNRGLLGAKIVDFSKDKYDGNHTDIVNMINASGASGVVVPFNVSVKIANNVGGWTHANGSHVPVELVDFVRDEAHLWPYKPQKELPLLSGNAASGFEFEYPLDGTGSINKPLLLEFSGNPNSLGWSKYRGGVIGIIKANGAFNGNVGYKLTFEPLYNINGDGSLTDFAVTLEWDAVPSTPPGLDKTFLPDSASANRNFLVKIAGPDGAYDQIRITPLDAMMK